MEVNLKVKPRTVSGKGPARRARSSGSVPGVLYGKGLDAVPLTVDVRELTKALTTESGMNVLINLQLDSKTKYLTMLREVQRHPIRGTLFHVDFLKIDRDVKIHADVPIHLVGESRGVKEGGVLEHHLWELRVQALPAEVPPTIEVDTTELGVGDHLRVSNISVPSGVEILTSLEEIIVSVVEPQVMRLPEEEAAAAEAEAAAAEAAAAEGEEAAPEAGEQESE